MVDSADEVLFQRIFNNPSHVLHQLLPDRRRTGLYIRWRYINASLLLLWSLALAIARAGDHYILRLFFFSRHTFSDVGKPTSPKLSHTTWLSIQQNRCYSDFFKVPPKTNGGRKTQNCTLFRAKSQTISAP